MELTVLSTKGLPQEGGVISVSASRKRQQGALPCNAPFKLEGFPFPMRLDIYSHLGRTQSCDWEILSKAGLDGPAFKVPLVSRDGGMMSITLQARTPSVDEKVANPLENEVEEYFEHHNLSPFLKENFDLLCAERPDDPYAFLERRFREAAALEAQTVPGNFTPSGGHNVDLADAMCLGPTQAEAYFADVKSCVCSTIVEEAADTPRRRSILASSKLGAPLVAGEKAVALDTQAAAQKSAAAQVRSAFSQQLETGSVGGHPKTKDRARKLLVNSAQDGSLMPILRKVQGITPQQRARSTLCGAVSNGSLMPILRKVQGVTPQQRARSTLLGAVSDGTFMPILRKVQGITPRQRARSSLLSAISSGKLDSALTKVLEEREEAEAEAAAGTKNTVDEEKAIRPLQAQNVATAATSVAGLSTQTDVITPAPALATGIAMQNMVSAATSVPGLSMQAPAVTPAPAVATTTAPQSVVSAATAVPGLSTQAPAITPAPAVATTTAPQSVVSAATSVPALSTQTPVMTPVPAVATATQASAFLNSIVDTAMPAVAVVTQTPAPVTQTPAPVSVAASFKPTTFAQSEAQTPAVAVVTQIPAPISAAASFKPTPFAQSEAARPSGRIDRTGSVSFTPRLTQFVPSGAAAVVRDTTMDSTPRLSSFVPVLSHKPGVAAARTGQPPPGGAATPRLTDFMPTEHVSPQRGGEAPPPSLGDFMPTEHVSPQRGGAAPPPRLADFMPTEHVSPQKGGVAQFVSFDDASTARESLMQFIPVEHGSAAGQGTTEVKPDINGLPAKQDLRDFLPIEYSYASKQGAGTRNLQDSPAWTPRLTQFMP